MLDYVPTKPMPEIPTRVEPTLRTSRTGQAAPAAPGRTRRAHFAREVLACLPVTTTDLRLPTPDPTNTSSGTQRFTRAVSAIDALAAAGRLREAIALARSTLAPQGPTVPAARLRCTLSSLLYSSGCASEAITEAERLLSDPDLPEDVHEAAEMVALDAVTALEDPSHTRDRAADAAAIVAARTRHGADITDADMTGADITAVALNNLAHTAWGQGRVNDALHLIQQAVRLATTDTSRPARPHPRLWLAGMLTSLRRFDQAHTQLRILRENNHGGGHGFGHTAYTAIHTANLHLAAGRVHNAAVEVDTGLATADLCGTELFTPWALSILATTALRRGDLNAATRHTHNSHKQRTAIGRTHGYAYSTWTAAQVTAATAGPQHALELLNDLLRTPHQLRRLLLTEPAAAAWLIRTSQACADHTHTRTVLAHARNLAANNPHLPTLTAAATHATGLLHRDPNTLQTAAYTHQDPWAQASAAEDLAALLAHQHHDDHAIKWYCDAIQHYQNSESLRDATRIQHKLRELGMHTQHRTVAA